MPRARPSPPQLQAHEEKQRRKSTDPTRGDARREKERQERKRKKTIALVPETSEAQEDDTNESSLAAPQTKKQSESEDKRGSQSVSPNKREEAQTARQTAQTLKGGNTENNTPAPWFGSQYRTPVPSSALPPPPDTRHLSARTKSPGTPTWKHVLTTTG